MCKGPEQRRGACWKRGELGKRGSWKSSQEQDSEGPRSPGAEEGFGSAFLAADGSSWRGSRGHHSPWKRRGGLRQGVLMSRVRLWLWCEGRMRGLNPGL